MEKDNVESYWKNQWIEPDASFRPLALERKEEVVKLSNSYRIYTKDGNKVMVKAASVLEALAQSGVKDPAFIEKPGAAHFNLFFHKGLTLGNAIEKKAIEETVTEQTAAEAPATPDQGQ